MEDIVIMNDLKKKIVICNFTKTISSAVLTAIAINIIMTNATKYSLIEGLLPFTLAIVIVALIDLYEYRCEKEDKINLDDLESRIQKLEKE
ncbi:MAG: hypothetical protein Q4Q18_09045 [Methanobrevibacter sp.]|nr:hypothetical protein [Methanobrevibacter sp.]